MRIRESWLQRFGRTATIVVASVALLLLLVSVGLAVLGGGEDP